MAWLNNKRCILLGTMVAAVLVILNLSLNANVPQEPHAIRVVCDSTKLPGLNKHGFNITFIEDKIVPGEIILQRHINGIVYGCNGAVCKKVKMKIQ